MAGGETVWGMDKRGLGIVRIAGEAPEAGMNASAMATMRARRLPRRASAGAVIGFAIEGLWGAW